MRADKYRTIDPEEAEMMVIIQRLEKILKGYPTGEEIAKAMNETTVERIRSLVSAVNSGGRKYVCSLRKKEKKLSGQPKKRGAPPVTYHLAQMFMVRHPSTGFFLTAALGFEKDENACVNEQQFCEHLAKEHGFTTEDLDNEFYWCTRTHYLSRDPPKKPTAFQILERTHAEEAWLEALTLEYIHNHSRK